MIAVDSNILIYAHRRDSPWHAPAAECVAALAEGRATWAIPWPCVHEFLAIATHPKVYGPCSTIDEACHQVDLWFESQSVVLLGETSEHMVHLRGVMESGRATGGRVHDAKIVAICLQHGVREFWTADRDFSRFPGISVRNPLTPKGA